MKTKTCSWENILCNFSSKKFLFSVLLVTVFLTLSVSALSVTVTDSSSNPVVNALVEVYGSDVISGSPYTLLGSAETNNSGVADIDLSSTPPTYYVYVAASKYDYSIYYPSFYTGNYSESLGKTVVELSTLPDPLAVTLDVVPTIWTDKTDYRPGETVYIYGSSFDVPTVQLTVSVAGNPTNLPDVTVGPDGRFSTSFDLTSGVLDTYTITASYNSQPLATTTFVDSLCTNIKIVAPTSGIADAYVNSYSSNTNFNGASLDILNYYGVSRSYLKFPLTSVPAGATIVWANLSMETYSTTYADSVAYVYLVTDDSWTETGITWNTKPSYSTFCNSTTVSDDDNRWSRWNITSCVNGEFNGDKNISLLVKLSENAPDYKQFYSKDQIYTVQFPYIEVCYYQTSVCGNGVKEAGEDCDPGQDVPGDCCNASCKFESNAYTCRAAVGTCDKLEKCTGSSATCPTDTFQPAGLRCGTCQTCDGSGSCSVMPTDDTECGTIDCDGLDTTCRNYDDIILNRCKSLGVCKSPNSADCTGFTNAPLSTPCEADQQFCTVDHCNGEGSCVYWKDYNCSDHNLAEITTCNNDPDNRPQTFDYAAAFTSTCDEQNNICTTGQQTPTHTCADANLDGGPMIGGGINERFCSAECDASGIDCNTHMTGDICYYSGTCNTDPTSCACSYSGQYCPVPGTVTNGTCYWGTQDCTDNGCSLFHREKTCYDTCSATNGPIDTSGPYVPIDSINVYPNPAGPMCLNNATVNATAIESCAHIHDAEYFVYLSADPHATCQVGGTEVRHGKMYAIDGTYDDDQVENITGTFYVGGLIDGGGYQICLKAQNDNGTWGGCNCSRLEIDNKHPLLVNTTSSPSILGAHWNDSKGYWVCADNFTYQAYFCDDGAQSCIAGAEYFIVPPMSFYQVAGTGLPMLPSDGHFSEPETTCDWANATVTNTQYTEGAHAIKTEAVDCACNWGKLIFQQPLYIVIDRTPPVSSKTVGDPKIQCNSTVLNLLGNNDSWDSCYFIKTSTLINLSSHDFDNSWDGNYSDAVTTYYRYRIKQNYTDSWGSWSQWIQYTSPFQFTEDSIHELEYYSVDRCGNEETHHFEIDIVDTKPPVTPKTLGTPKIECPAGYASIYSQNPTDGCYFINQNTLVTLNCNDQQPHPVGGEAVYYRYRLTNETFGGWMQYTEPFYYNKDSTHMLEWYCIDALNNTEETHTEMDVVDSLPPESSKSFISGVTHIDPDTNETWITNETTIELTCSDPNPHPSGELFGVTIYYRYSVDGGPFTSWTAYNGWRTTFQYNEDSNHMLEWYCIDALNNTEQTHTELDRVDSTPPTTIKTYGQPVYPAEGYPKWITSETPITLTAQDGGPICAVGVNDIYYKVTLVDDSYCGSQELCQEAQGGAGQGEVYEGPFTIAEDSCHLIKYWSVDELSNTETVKKQCVYVDNKAPDLTKVIGDPKIQGDGFTWITQSTPIDMYCVDQDPHPVDHVNIQYRYNVDNGSWSNWMQYTGSFTFAEDSYHTLQYYCEDALGNSNGTMEQPHEQYYKVDSTPPTTIKTYGTPFYTNGAADWITSQTPITLTATDGGEICHAGVNKTYWRNTLVDNEFCASERACAGANGTGSFNEYTVPFYKPEDSCHLIEFYSVDELGNVEQTKRQCVYVDNKPPISNKTLGDPKKQVDCSTVDSGTYTDGCYYATLQTPIMINCTDQDPHPIDNVTIYYKVDWKNESGDGWQEGQWVDVNSALIRVPYDNDSYHRLSWYCVDALNNTENMRSELDIVDTQPPIITKTLGDPKIPCEGSDQAILFSDDFEGYQNTGGLGLYAEMNARGWTVYDYTHPVNDDDIFLSNFSTPGDLHVTIGDDSNITANISTLGYGNIKLNYTRRTYQTESADRLRMMWRIGNSGPWNYLENISNNTWSTKSWSLPGADNQPLIQVRFFLDNGNDDYGLVDNVTVTGEGEACDYYITQNTNITLTCVDQQPHPVDNVTIYYKYNVNGGEWTTPVEYNGQEITFNFPEDSRHTLEYWCIDELGNTYEPTQEIDIVDTQPPVTTKVIGQPKISDEGFTWITSQTLITLNCIDLQPHPVDRVTVYYRYALDNGEPTNWTTYDGSFTLPNDSVHTLEYYCVDALNNTEVIKNEIDKVDNTPPVTTKMITGCHTPCNPGEGCDYWVGDDTIIGFSAVDGGAICAVGVNYTKYSVSGEYSQGWSYYDPAHNITFGSGHYDDDGYYHFQYYSVDELGNAEVKHNETDVYDDDDPFGFVLNPVSGRVYHDGETFTVYAPASDAGYPPSGVASCEFYAIDINYEGINESQIHNMHDYLHALELNHVNYTLVYLGEVPYVNGVCRGTLTVPNPSNITDKAYMMIRIKDRSCNEWFGYARDDLENGRKIIMDFDNEAPRVIITDRDGLLDEGFVEDNHHFIIYASVEEYQSGADECWADLFRDGEGLEFIESYPGVLLSEYQCRVDGNLPTGLEDGIYMLTVLARDEEFNIGNDSVRFLVDGTPPVKTLYSPTSGGSYGANGIPIKIGMDDETAGVDPSTVQYRIYAPGVDLDAIYVIGGLYDSGWRSTTIAEGNQWVGNYTSLFNITAENITSGTYYMRVRGCDVLYPAPLTNGSQIPAHCTDPLLSIIIDLDPPIGPTNVIINGTIITWNAATDAGSGMTSGHYNIYNSSGDIIGVVNSTGTQTYSFTISNTNDIYKVSAVDSVGNEGAHVLAQKASVPPAGPIGGGGGGGSSSGGGTISTGGSSSGGTGGSTGGTGETTTFTQCSQVGLACATTADCCEGQCVNYKCSEQETTGPATRVDILAPPSALLNEVVVLKLVDENNQSVAGGTVLIISPTRESLVLITDSNGEAGFKATDEGVYTYNAPGHYLVAIRTTNVVKPAEAPTGLTGTPASEEGTQQQAPTSVGMALAAYAPWVLGLLALLLIVFFLATRKRKEKNNKK